VSSQDITLSLEERKQVRKGLNKLKDAGLIPAVIHNPGKDSIIVSAPFKEAVKVYHQAGKHHPVNVKVGTQTYLTIIKDADFETKKHTLRHLVFGIIKQDAKVETEVPITLVGDAPASKAGLLVVRMLNDIELEAFPRDLPDEVTVSVEKLVEVSDKITVADIDVPKGVTILTEATHPIAIVEETPAQVSEEAAEESAEAAEAAEATTEEAPATESKE